MQQPLFDEIQNDIDEKGSFLVGNTPMAFIYCFRKVGFGHIRPVRLDLLDLDLTFHFRRDSKSRLGCLRLKRLEVQLRS